MLISWCCDPDTEVCGDTKDECLPKWCNDYECPSGQKAVPIYLNEYDEPQGCYCCPVCADNNGPISDFGYKVVGYVDNSCCGGYTSGEADPALSGIPDYTWTGSPVVGRNGGDWFCATNPYVLTYPDNTITEGYEDGYSKFCSKNSTYSINNYCYCSSVGNPMLAYDNPC